MFRTAAAVLDNAISKVGNGSVVVVDQVVSGSKRVSIDELTCASVAGLTTAD
jgi:hypothetical protein